MQACQRTKGGFVGAAGGASHRQIDQGLAQSCCSNLYTEVKHISGTLSMAGWARRVEREYLQPDRTV